MSRPRKVSTAARDGTRRDALIALRNLAKQIDVCDSGRDLAALSKRLMDVMPEIDSMPNPDEKDASPIDNARERMAKRASQRRGKS